MKFIWVIGIEGSGHHMIFDAVFSQFKDRNNFLYESDGDGDLEQLHNQFSAYFDYRSDLSTKKYAKMKIYRLLSEFKKSETDNELILFDRNSSPYNNPRDTLRRWDILEFVDLVSEHADPYLLVLVRNPINATYSCLRRGFTDNISLQAKIIEDNFIFINNQINAIQDTNSYRILDYDTFFDKPKFYTDQLAEWLDFQPDDLANEDLLHKPKGVEDIPDQLRNILDDFFTEQRQVQWQFLYDSPQNLDIS